MTKYQPNNINELINDYRINIEAETDAEMIAAYNEDRDNFLTVRNFIEFDLKSEAKKVINNMDTCVREMIIVAIAKDFGTKFVADNFGYNIKSWAI